MRTCIKEPIPELYDAYGALQNAIDAHLAGGISEAAEHFKLANCPVVWTWLNTAWVGVTQHVVTLRPLGDTRKIPSAERDPDRNIAKNVKQMVLARDGYRCRYCSLPVVHADIRKIAHKLHPEAVPWNPRIASQQHSAFQAFWLQFDHVEPHSHGGQSAVDNVVVTCALCNFAKDRHTLRQLDVEDPRLRSPLPSEYDGLERFRSVAPISTKVVNQAQAVVPRRGGRIPSSEDTASFFFPGAKISGGYVGTPLIAGRTRWFKFGLDVEGEQVVRAGIAGCIVRCSPKLLARRGIDPDLYADRILSDPRPLKSRAESAPDDR